MLFRTSSGTSAGGLHHVMVRGLPRQVITPHPAVTRARDGIASLWVEELGRSGRALALPLGVQPAAWRRALRKAG
jgi:hypothetical protein